MLYNPCQTICRNIIIIIIIIIKYMFYKDGQ